MNGRFITFEGGEGVGKSTHIRALAEFLDSHGIKVLLTREPGGTLLGESIRALLQHDAGGESPLPRAEVLLFCASRAQLCEQVVRPALKNGIWVLCDRFEDSTLAYQGAGRGWCVDELRLISRFASGVLVPDLTILLDLPAEIGLRRVRERANMQDRIEREDLAFHQRLRDGFLKLATEESERIRVVDANREIEFVKTDVRRIVGELIV